MKNILYKKNGCLCYIQINRPEKLNSLNLATINQLQSAVDSAINDPEVRVVILRSSEKAFVAGADILEMSNLNSVEAKSFSSKGQELFNTIENSHKPFIASINGFALGGGCELLLSCHIRLCSAGAKFGQPEVGLGLIAGFGGTQRLPRLIGKGVACKMLLSGEIIDSSEAFRIGLVDKIADDLDAEVDKISLKISKNSPNAISKTLESINKGLDSNIKTGLLIERDLFAQTFEDSDSKEGMDAFINKRKPKFKDI
jgi:enoyl-CoA hydratase